MSAIPPQDVILAGIIQEAERTLAELKGKPASIDLVDSVHKMAVHIFEQIKGVALSTASSAKLTNLVGQLRNILPKQGALWRLQTISLDRNTTAKLNEAIQKLNSLLKKISKLLKIGLGTLPLKIVDDILIGEHVVERMVYFGHRIDISKTGKPLFSYTKQTSLREYVHTNDMQLLKKFYKTNHKKGLQVWLPSSRPDSLYDKYNLKELTWEKFRDLISPPDTDTFCLDNALVIFPTEKLTLNQLEHRGVLFKSSTGTYYIDSDYSYTHLGFTKQSSYGWSELPIFNISKTPPPPKSLRLKLSFTAENLDRESLAKTGMLLSNSLVQAAKSSLWDLCQQTMIFH